MRRRRRWLIVALLLVLVSGVAWWNWPRGDARFVGKWQFHFAVNDNPEDVNVVELNANGRGASVIPGVIRTPFEWHVQGNQLVMDGEIRNHFLQKALNLFLGFISSPTKYTENRATFELVEVGADKIRMRDKREPDVELLLIRERE